MMPTSVDSSAGQSSSVMVFLSEEDALPQPQAFQFCPLGIQFYSPKPLAKLQFMDLSLHFPNDDGTSEEVSCLGIVANCQEEQDQATYHIWVKFLDLPESAKGRIQCQACDTKLLCPLCENY